MGYGGFNGGFGGPNLQNLMRQAQKMQAEMEEKKRELEQKEFKASAGGGMVEITMLGSYEIKQLKINPEVVDRDDVEMLEDLVTSALSDVLKQISKAEKEIAPQMPGM